MFSTLRTGNEEDVRSNEEGSSNQPNEAQTSSSYLDWDTRVYYFIGFFCLSIISSFCGSALLMSGKLTGFCVLTSLSSALSLIGTFFLSGPLNQLKRMADKSRWLASLLYIGAIAATLVSGSSLILFNGYDNIIGLRGNPPLAVIFVVLQYIAMAYYSLTYIPYG
ncbi:hypothetical protein PRIPAC_83687, partial [Pristionchus pacificus]|uniref:Vesicle transport protein n=1 Tax=Pristionchus pacificus TaxID=54126 RepID=A0A2A6BM51_PRIPA